MEEKRKYLEYFDGAFDSTVADKMKPENWPYVAYSKTEGMAYTVIPEENQSGYQMVDLGLPSGIKWADRNIGAENPQDNGLYFSWGNVEGHTVDENGKTVDGYSFDQITYSTTLGGQYTGSTLDSTHDAATVNIGEEWRMPTSTETLELVEGTDQYYIDLSGNTVAKSELDGSKLRSICFVKKGESFDYNERSNFIEFPFAGYFFGSLLQYEGSCGSIWSSSFNESKGGYFYFHNDGRFFNIYSDRFVGRSVRGVHP